MAFLNLSSRELLGSIAAGTEVKILASSLTEIANIQIPANKIKNGIVVEGMFGVGSSSMSGRRIISAGASGGETVVSSHIVAGATNTNIPVSFSIMVDTLSKTVANAVTFAGSTGATGAGSLGLAHAFVWTY